MLRSIENQTLDPSFCLQQQTPRRGGQQAMDHRGSTQSLLLLLIVHRCTMVTECEYQVERGARRWLEKESLYWGFSFKKYKSCLELWGRRCPPVASPGKESLTGLYYLKSTSPVWSSGVGGGPQERRICAQCTECQSEQIQCSAAKRRESL